MTSIVALDRLIEACEIPRASILCSKLLHAHPNDGELLTRSAFLLGQTGRHGIALALCDYLLKRCPTDARDDLLALKGHLLAEMGDHTGALATFKQGALTADAGFNIATQLLGLGNWPFAWRAWQLRGVVGRRGLPLANDLASLRGQRLLWYQDQGLGDRLSA